MVTIMVSTAVFGMESEDSAINTEDIEPVVLLQWAYVFDGVLGMLMRIQMLEGNFDDDEEAVVGGLYGL